MKTEQAAFNFTPPPPPPIGEVERLLAHLSANPGFLTAKQLAAALNLSDRRVRQIAEQSDGLIVSGPGSPGYCHLYHCDPETIGHITATQISQARNMIRRAILTRRRAHALIR
jgi:hypothetical protein